MRICPACGQKVRMPYKIPLSKNNISYLFRAMVLMKKKGYIQASEINNVVRKASPSAELTRLGYLGALAPFFTPEDVKKQSKRSGKWAITKAGLFFLKGTGTLPSYVIVDKERVVEKGPEVKINDKRIKLHTEDDIWKIMIEFWEEDKKKDVQLNLFNY